MMVSTYRTGIGIIKIETYRIEQGWEEVCRDGKKSGRRNTSFQGWEELWYQPPEYGMEGDEQG